MNLRYQVFKHLDFHESIQKHRLPIFIPQHTRMMMYNDSLISHLEDPQKIDQPQLDNQQSTKSIFKQNPLKLQYFT